MRRLTWLLHLSKPALFAAALCLAPQAVSAEGLAAPEIMEIDVDADRTVPVRVWTTAHEPRGVALFSHGYNSWPSAYDVLIERLLDEGYAVVAPLHLDSLRSEMKGRIDPQQGFASRLADMTAASALAQSRFADLPILGVGHSFGSLVALTRAGGLPAVSEMNDASVDAILAFSTPGRIPGLVGDEAFTSVDVPVMLVSGSRDIVSGHVTNPADHRIYVERTPGASYLLWIEDAAHNLVREEAMMERHWPAIDAFIARHVEGDDGAHDALDSLTIPADTASPAELSND